MSEIDNQIENEIDSVEAADAALESISQNDNGPIRDEAQAAPTPQTVDEWELTVGGKPIKAKRDQVLQWAQMGYDAPNKIRSLTKEIESWKQKESRFSEIEKKYGEIDKYVREKPDFWNHVLQSWEQRNQSLQDTSNPIAQVVSQLQSEVQNLVQYKNQVEERQSQVRAQQEDQAYMQEFEKTKSAYPDIDFVTPDDEGKTLEYKVLEFAEKRKIGDFDTAFKAFYHDELMKRAESRAKENLSKEKIKNTKLGILGTSQTPTKRPSGDHRGKSWNELAEEALQEHGLR